jgi:branched-chain amino acid aminotransferase
MKYAFFKGKIVPFEEAKISVMTHAFNYGTGVFEGIRGYYCDDKMHLLQMKEHYQRLHNSCRIMRIHLKYSIEELIEITKELAIKNAYKEDIYIRPLAYKAGEVIGVRLHNLDDDFTMFVSPFGSYLDISKGIRCCTSSWRRIDENMIPARAKVTGVYVNSAFAKSEAVEDGFDEAIMLDTAGGVCEGSAENLFIIRDGKLITPTISENILEGITRNSLIKMAKDDFDLETIERRVARTELYIADELFLCGTGAQVTPVLEVDRRQIGRGQIGPITTKLQTAYFDAVRGKNKKYSHWIVPVTY